MRFKSFAAAVIVGGLAVAPQSVHAITYDIGWTGASGYTMTGAFSFNDALIGTGPINGSQIDSLVIEVFHNGVSQGIWDLLADGITAGFNFNFDTTLERFLVGGHADSSSGQRWDTVAAAASGCKTVGFVSGDFRQGLCIGGGFVAASYIETTDSTLTATRRVPVPEPASIGLFGAGLAGLLLLRRQQRG